MKRKSPYLAPSPARECNLCDERAASSDETTLGYDEADGLYNHFTAMIFGSSVTPKRTSQIPDNVVMNNHRVRTLFITRVGLATPKLQPLVTKMFHHFVLDRTM